MGVRLRDSVLAYRIAVGADPIRSALLMTIAAVMAVAALGVPLGLRWIIEGMATANGSASRGFIAVLLGITVPGTGRIVSMALSNRAGESVRRDLNSRIARTAGEIETIEYVERPELQGRVWLSEVAGNRLGDAPSQLVTMVAACLQIVLAFALMVRLSPVWAAVGIAALPVAWAGHSNSLDRARTREATVQASSELSMLGRTIGEPGPILEVRVMNLTGLVSARMKAASHANANRWYGFARRSAARTFCAHTVLAGAIVVAVVIAARSTVMEGYPPGNLVLILGLGSLIATQMSALVALGGNVSTYREAADAVIWLRDEKKRSETQQLGSNVPTSIQEGIEFDRVTFYYPGLEKKALDDVSVVIPAGRVVALVGENGAGKSTMVKLLTRMYRPSAGRIRIDGNDLSEFDVAQWRERCSGAFQDYLSPLFLLREAVGIGSTQLIARDQVLMSAIGKAEAQALLSRLPFGLDTQLGLWLGGLDLSTGEWQRLALARALMPRSPLFVVFDEPTASLDPLAEKMLFTRFREFARAWAAETGCITMLVSHRFGTVHMADDIMVLHKGALVEFGTHEDLMDVPGRYRELFELQAKAYS